MPIGIATPLAKEKRGDKVRQHTTAAKVGRACKGQQCWWHGGGSPRSEKCCNGLMKTGL